MFWSLGKSGWYDLYFRNVSPDSRKSNKFFVEYFNDFTMAICARIRIISNLLHTHIKKSMERENKRDMWILRSFWVLVFLVHERLRQQSQDITTITLIITIHKMNSSSSGGRQAWPREYWHKKEKVGRFSLCVVKISCSTDSYRFQSHFKQIFDSWNDIDVGSKNQRVENEASGWGCAREKAQNYNKYRQFIYLEEWVMSDKTH